MPQQDRAKPSTSKNDTSAALVRSVRGEGRGDVVARAEKGDSAGAELALYDVISTYMENFLSDHTRKAYERDFRDFGAFLESRRRHIEHPRDVVKKDVIAFRDHLRELYSPTTVNRKMSAVSSLFGELQNAQVVPSNPCDGVKRPQSKVKKERLGFSDKEVLELLNSFDEATLQGLNDKAVLTFLFYTGCRISEALAVRVSDLDEIDGIRIAHLRGKGDKLRTIPIHPKLYSVLRLLVEMRAKKRSEHLFTRVRVNSNEPLSRQAVFQLLKSAMEKLGMGRSRSLHSSRRTVISNLLQSGSRLESVAQLAGHSSVNTTLRYLVRSEKLEDSPLLTLKYR